MDVISDNKIEGVTATAEESVPGGALGKDEFLKLLITQMQNQDPLDPMNSQETIAQLAQFSALEQMQNVSDQVGAMRHETGILQAMLLEGKAIVAQTEGGEEISGVVDKVMWGDDGVKLLIGETEYALKDFVSLSIAEQEEAESAVE